MTGHKQADVGGNKGRKQREKKYSVLVFIEAIQDQKHAAERSGRVDERLHQFLQSGRQLLLLKPEMQDPRDAHEISCLACELQNQTS